MNYWLGEFSGGDGWSPVGPQYGGYDKTPDPKDPEWKPKNKSETKRKHVFTGLANRCLNYLRGDYRIDDSSIAFSRGVETPRSATYLKNFAGLVQQLPAFLESTSYRTHLTQGASGRKFLDSNKWLAGTIDNPDEEEKELAIAHYSLGYKRVGSNLDSVSVPTSNSAVQLARSFVSEMGQYPYERRQLFASGIERILTGEIPLISATALGRKWRSAAPEATTDLCIPTARLSLNSTNYPQPFVAIIVNDKSRVMHRPPSHYQDGIGMPEVERVMPEIQHLVASICYANLAFDYTSMQTDKWLVRPPGGTTIYSLFNFQIPTVGYFLYTNN